jgi:hypothetical protein
MSRGVAHGVELALDHDAARDVDALCGLLGAAGIASLRDAPPDVHPHVSLAVASSGDPEAIAAALAGLAGAGLPVLELSSVGAFVAPAPVVFLGVTVTPALLELHESAHRRLAAAGVELWAHYEPGRWVPHCTLSMRPASLGAAFEALSAARLPIAAAPVALRVVEVPTGKVVAEVR